ncbi:helix-turn-helix domain-containing protein [Serratia fonticola]|uniref:helix-turn-helix domain-containing protein n=1 Tax=Serratia fonticola TaxID=47917 RepID=UPI001376FD77|nr:LuxR family transcriptional regulator [Serratia fonticola]NCG54507.1 hypothetical protein [Serratia fonticola]
MKPLHHVIIQHPCSFSRVGMKAIITSLGKQYTIQETASLNAFTQEDDQPPICSPVLLMTYIPSCTSLINTMHAIDKLQFQSAHALKTIVLTNRLTWPLAMNLLDKYPGTYFFMEELVSSGTLSETVKNLLGREGGDALDEPLYLSDPLTSRERHVIKQLLKGMPICKIANGLGLNYKTVSHHKISALRKLGFRHINALFSEKWHLNAGETNTRYRQLFKESA